MQQSARDSGLALLRLSSLQFDLDFSKRGCWAVQYMKSIAPIALILAISAVQSLGDGKMFWQEEVPPTIPYQRAIILFSEGTQTLILQSRYEIPKGAGESKLGWVVPLPAVPEVASMPAGVASHLFFILNLSTQPSGTEIGSIVFVVVLSTVAILALLTLLFCLVSLVAPFPARFIQKRGWLARCSIGGLGICMIMMIIHPSAGTLRGSHSVELISENRVGIYDVSVVRSDDSKSLVDWLNSHDFNFGEDDTAAFDLYVSQGWCFVVAIINPDIDEAEHRILSEGLAAPLILRFPHPTPIYPVALTATGGFDTEILIYLASSAKMTCDGRLTLRFAGQLNQYILQLLPLDVDPEGFFDPKVMNYRYLCKFSDRLTPDEMRKDIIFRETTDQEPYREHIVKW